jgi:hypothetical protein
LDPPLPKVLAMKRVRLGVAIAVGLLVAGLVAGPIVLRPLLSRWVWNELSAHLENLFDARLEADSFHVSLFPTVRVDGTGLHLTKRDQPDVTPLIAIRTFSVSTSLRRLWDGNVRSVTVDGVTISIPPDKRPSMKKAAADPADSGSVPSQDLTGSAGVETGRARAKRIARGLTIDEILTTAATLIIEPQNP